MRDHGTQNIISSITAQILAAVSMKNLTMQIMMKLVTAVIVISTMII